MIYVSKEVAANESLLSGQPKLSRSDIWKGLLMKAENALPFVPGMAKCNVIARTPNGLVFLVGMAWLPDGVEAVRDEEHDAHAWWPADVAQWPEEADETVRRMGALLA